MRKINVYGLWKVDVKGEYPYTGNIRPKETCRISVALTDLKCSCDVNALDSHYVSLQGKGAVCGEGMSTLDRALEMAFCIMVDEEVADVSIDLPKRYIDDGLSDNVLLTCKAYLKIVEPGKPVYKHTVEEKLTLASKYKNLGVELYKEGSGPKQMCAYLFFGQAVKWLSMIGPSEAESHLSEIEAVKMQCYNNLGLYHLHKKNYLLTVVATTNVLQMDSKNVKALYRRAVANMELQNYDVAEDDIKFALMIDPSSVPIKKQQEELRKRQKVVSEKYAIAMKKFFS